MDLAKFFDLPKLQDDGIDVAIVEPGSGEATDIVIRVAGPDSARQRKARSRVNQNRINASRNRRVTANDLEDDALRVTAASVMSWRGVEESGAAVEFSAENAERLFRAYPWLYEQVASVVGDRANFIKS